MIDTIILYVHGIQKYNQIVNVLEKTSSKTAITFVEKVDKETGEIFRDKKGAAVFFHDSDRFLFRTVRDFCNLPSSTFHPVFTVNRKADRIEFNFSIPKFIYGSNVLQFINYFDQGARSIFDLLFQFLNTWRTQEFIQVIEKTDIEIARLDLCYNQFFNTEKQALDYLQQQKVILEKKSSRGGHPAYYKTGIFWKTKTHSFKIYHKGTEFRKGDLNELRKVKHNLDLKKITEVADRVLRYEMGFRKSYFNYLFQQMYYPPLSRYTEKKSIYFSLFTVYKVDNLSSDKMSIFKSKTVDKIGRNFCMKSKYDYYKDFIKAYDLKYTSKEKKASWRLEYRNEINVTFNFNLFENLFKMFWKEVHAYKVTSVNDMTSVRNLLSQKNDDQKSKNRLSGKKGGFVDEQRLSFWISQSKQKSLFKFVEDGHLSRSRYYAIIRIFKTMGLSDFNPDVSLFTPDFEYTDYKFFFGSFH